MMSGAVAQEFQAAIDSALPDASGQAAVGGTTGIDPNHAQGDPNQLGIDPTAASVEVPLPLVDVASFSQEQAEFLRTHFAGESLTKAQEQINKVRGVHDRQMTQARQQLETALAMNAEAVQFITEYAKTHGDPRDVDSFLVKLTQAQGRVAQARQTAQSELQSYFSEQDAKHQSFLSEMSVDPQTGAQLFDVNDPEITRAAAQVKGLAQRFILGGRRDERLYQAGEAAQANLERLIRNKALAGARRAAPDPALQRVQQQQQAQQIQAARGAQLTAPSGGAGVMDKTALQARAKDLAVDKGDLMEIHRNYLRLIREQREAGVS